jgi:hypothetical protein
VEGGSIEKHIPVYRTLASYVHAHAAEKTPFHFLWGRHFRPSFKFLLNNFYPDEIANLFLRDLSNWIHQISVSDLARSGGSRCRETDYPVNPYQDFQNTGSTPPLHIPTEIVFLLEDIRIIRHIPGNSHSFSPH